MSKENTEKKWVSISCQVSPETEERYLKEHCERYGMTRSTLTRKLIEMVVDGTIKLGVKKKVRKIIVKKKID